MGLEDEMRHEVSKLENEIANIHIEVEKLSSRIKDLKISQQKKDHNLKVLKEMLGLAPVTMEEVQLTFRNITSLRKTSMVK